MILKIDYEIEKILKVTYDVILWRNKDYVTESSSILVALLFIVFNI